MVGIVGAIVTLIAASIQDTAVVILEWPASVESSGSWSSGDDISDGIGILFIVGCVTLAWSVLAIRGTFAMSISTCVGIVALKGLSSSLLGPIVSIICTASVTSVCAAGANTVYKVLLRKAQKFSGLNGPSTFNGASGTKGPARSALALVLDCINLTLIDPVNGGSSTYSVNNILGWDMLQS